ncbi:MAG: hypothetical protein EAZ28_22105 [Oscillatoriales cyanobacterium]|nr:MAG: hypothetical protein EAZ28_22105 [Oscillatoriales cyanobacterium]
MQQHITFSSIDVQAPRSIDRTCDTNITCVTTENDITAELDFAVKSKTAVVFAGNIGVKCDRTSSRLNRDWIGKSAIARNSNITGAIRSPDRDRAKSLLNQLNFRWSQI